MDDARAKFAASGIPATLEDVFFQATQIGSEKCGSEPTDLMGSDKSDGDKLA
jgi:hypothetical protein